MTVEMFLNSVLDNYKIHVFEDVVRAAISDPILGWRKDLEISKTFPDELLNKWYDFLWKSDLKECKLTDALTVKAHELIKMIHKYLSDFNNEVQLPEKKE